MILSTTTTAACSKKPEESATTAGHSAAGGAAGAAGSDRHAAADQATDDLQAKRAEDTKVAEAKATADADVVAAHKVTQEQLQANFDASDRRINELAERVEKLTGATKTKASTALAVARADEATVMGNLARLREASLAGWEAAKAQVEASTVALDKSIDALAATLP